VQIGWGARVGLHNQNPTPKAPHCGAAVPSFYLSGVLVNVPTRSGMHCVCLHFLRSAKRNQMRPNQTSSVVLDGCSLYLMRKQVSDIAVHCMQNPQETLKVYPGGQKRLCQRHRRWQPACRHLRMQRTKPSHKAISLPPPHVLPISRE
jgi:hypothetical protein